MDEVHEMSRHQGDVKASRDCRSWVQRGLGLRPRSECEHLAAERLFRKNSRIDTKNICNGLPSPKSTYSVHIVQAS